MIVPKANKEYLSNSFADIAAYVYGELAHTKTCHLEPI
jgi:hypothetical protein